ncbi:MAG: Crp/Fnr family transcriptional regulator, partial [Bdellovibrionales bacterium]|nr:Crp/Fnr family transcriptional regulator [Bdellovibrionales bacterium]
MTDSVALQGAIHELARFALFQGLDHAQIAALCAGGEVRVSRHRDLLFEFGGKANVFGVVLGGAYKLSRTGPSGEDSVIHFSGPGDILAALVMPQPQPVYPVSARAMGPSRVLLLRREVYLRHWLPNPLLISRVQGLLSTRMTRFQGMKAMQRAPLSAKVAAFLLQLVAEDKGGQSLEIPLPLTRKEIADALGVTVESVIRVMSEWAKQGHIQSSDQTIRILHPQYLVE